MAEDANASGSPQNHSMIERQIGRFLVLFIFEGATLVLKENEIKQIVAEIQELAVEIGRAIDSIVLKEKKNEPILVRLGQSTSSSTDFVQVRRIKSSDYDPLQRTGKIKPTKYKAELFHLFNGKRISVGRLYRTGDVRKTSELAIDDAFTLPNIEDEIKLTSLVLNDVLSGKLNILHNIVESQCKLISLAYFKYELLHKEETINSMVLLTLSQLPYRSISILMLIKNSLHSFARPLIRQFFEAAVTSKYSMIEPAVVSEWKSGRVKLSYAFNKLSKRLDTPLDISKLRMLYGVLSETTHPNVKSLQDIRFADAGNIEELTKATLESKLFSQSEQTLDLFFLVLMMNYDLLKWYSPDLPKKKAVNLEYGLEAENLLRQEIDELTKRYYAEGEGNIGVNENLKDILSQFIQPWT